MKEINLQTDPNKNESYKHERKYGTCKIAIKIYAK